MERQKIADVLQEQMCDVFELGDIEIHDEMTAADVSNWDSFNHVRLIVALEERLDLTLPAGRIVSVQNVGALIDLIEEVTNEP